MKFRLIAHTEEGGLDVIVHLERSDTFLLRRGFVSVDFDYAIGNLMRQLRPRFPEIGDEGAVAPEQDFDLDISGVHPGSLDAVLVDVIGVQFDDLYRFLFENREQIRERMSEAVLNALTSSSSLNKEN